MKELSSERHDVVVIGAGQAGLAASWHLAERGIEHVVLEANPRVGDVWRRRYDSLRLYSPAAYDCLPGLPLPLPRGAFPTGRQMGDYLESYVAHHQLPVRTSSRVDRLTSAGGSSPEYLVAAGQRRYTAPQVIVATGAFQRPRVPGFVPQLDPGIRQLHSAEYRGPGQLVAGPVLVVGLSHSGADIAHEVATAGHRVTISGRTHGELPFPIDSRRMRLAWPVASFLAGRVLSRATPIGRRVAGKVRQGGGPLLRVRRADLGRAGVRIDPARTVGVQDGQPLLADGTRVDVANVIWCTGFEPDFSWIDLPVTGADGWPEERRGVVPGSPGLYFLGLPFLFSFASMLVLGASRDARHVVDVIEARRGARGQPAASAAPVAG